jgi:hypothetical protein
LNEEKEKIRRYVHRNFLGVKGEFVSVHFIKAHRWSRGKAPIILNLGARWEWEVNMTP